LTIQFDFISINEGFLYKIIDKKSIGQLLKRKNEGSVLCPQSLLNDMVNIRVLRVLMKKIRKV